MPIDIDDRHYPLIIQTMHGEVSDADVEAMFAYYDALLSGSSAHHAIVVHSPREASILSSKQRRRTAEWSNAHADKIRRHNVGTSIVLYSAVARGAVSALNCLFPPISPQHITGDYSNAIAWCVERLDGAGAQVPDAVRKLVIHQKTG